MSPVAMPKRSILIHSQYPSLKYSKIALKKLFLNLDTINQYKIPPGELSIALLDDIAITQLHENHLQDATPTDVITFPGDRSMDFAGEICISIDHAQSMSHTLNISLAEEITLYLIHGWLHLAGLNDHTEAQKKDMRSAESTVLDIIQTNHWMPSFDIHS